MNTNAHIDSHILALAISYSAAYGLSYETLSQSEQERWIDKMLGETSEEEQFLNLGDFTINDDNY
ncbi:hypothetical protein [Xanthomonas phage vB_XooS_NR08]|nr:hypothetical protein [Xanthomonas phage vB_XooS_NR08]